MQQYLMSLTSRAETLGRQTSTITAPKYMSLFAGESFTVVPFGGEGWGIVSLKNANPAVAGNADVFSFPVNLTTTLAASDVIALLAFLSVANIPSDQIVAGVPFAQRRASAWSLMHSRLTSRNRRKKHRRETPRRFRLLRNTIWHSF